MGAVSAAHTRTQTLTRFLVSNLNPYPVGVDKSKVLRFKAEKLVDNFKEFKHHMARVAQQELHWDHALKEMKSKKQYHMVSVSSRV